MDSDVGYQEEWPYIKGEEWWDSRFQKKRGKYKVGLEVEEV